MTFDRITVRAEQMGGVPCIRGLRIPVATGVGMVADGMTTDEILAAYPDLEAAGPPPSVHAWRRALADGDAVLIALPEYGHSLPGALKNAIDWVIGSGELYRKVVGITAAVPHESRGLRELEALARTLGAVDAILVWNAPLVHRHGVFGGDELRLRQILDGRVCVDELDVHDVTQVVVIDARHQLTEQFEALTLPGNERVLLPHRAQVDAFA